MTTDTTQQEAPETGRDVPAELKRAARIIGLVMVIAAIVPFVVFAVPQVVGGDHGFVILSGSMEPALSPGDVVIVDASRSVAVGDVITFDDGKEIPTTHRVIGVENGQYVTKGDANENADSQPVAPGSVLGRVTITIPLIGYLILWANTPVGYVGLVLVPLGLLLGNELLTYARRGDDAEGGPTASPAPIPTNQRGDTASVNATRAPETATAASGSTSIAAANLQLTMLATAVLFGYAVWNVYGEVTMTGAPHPVSVGAVTGSGLGLLFAAWVTISKRLAHRAEEQPPGRETGAPRTDSGRSKPQETAVRTDGAATTDGRS